MLVLPPNQPILSSVVFAGSRLLFAFASMSIIWYGSLRTTQSGFRFACIFLGLLFFCCWLTGFICSFLPLFSTSALIISTILLTVSLMMAWISDLSLAPKSVVLDDSANILNKSEARKSDLISICRSVADKYSLTEREFDVLCLLSRGNSLKSISEKLVVSENTVKSHRRRIYMKLGINSRQSLIDLIDREQDRISQ